MNNKSTMKSDEFWKQVAKLEKNYDAILNDLIYSIKSEGGDKTVSFIGNYTSTDAKDSNKKMKMPFVVFQNYEELSFLSHGILKGHAIEALSIDNISNITGTINTENIKFDKKYNLRKFNPKTIKYNGKSENKDGAYKGTFEFGNYGEMQLLTKGTFELTVKEITKGAIPS